MAMPVIKQRVELGPVINDLPRVPVLITNTLILPANLARKTATIQAAAANGDPVFLRFETDGTAVANHGLALNANDVYRITPEDWYGGAVYGIAGGQDTMYVNVQETE